LLVLAVAIWIGRWVAMELASYAGHRVLPRREPRPDDRVPGEMPGPKTLG